jgi:hypothetical protein
MEVVIKELLILKKEVYIMNNNELKHYGILGMKWGVRRYQNKDGTLTPAGKKRYIRDAQRTSTQLGRTMITRKRQLAADKSDLEKLNSGKHLSVGLTKKRQDAYDKRDKAALERRIKDNEQRGHLTKKVKKNPVTKIRKFLEKQAQNNANRYMKKANKKEDIRNQKLQKKAAELVSKYGDKYKVKVKGNKIVLSDGVDEWTIY